MKILKFSIIIMLLLVIFSSSTSALDTIQVEQDQDHLMINHSANQNITIEFYNSQQRLFNDTLDNFNATLTNVTIPVDISSIGGYVRVSYVNESITTKNFIEISPWIAGNNNNGSGNDEEDTPLDKSFGNSESEIDSSNSSNVFGIFFPEEEKQNGDDDLILLIGSGAFAVISRRRN